MSIKLKWLFLVFQFWSPLLATDPDQNHSFASLVDSRGFTLQEYFVKTADGYILTVHRVVPKNNYFAHSYSQTRKPVIVQHGLILSSVDFFINSPTLKPYFPSGSCGDDLGFCLVQTGRYDIWLPNFRGNGVSMSHETLTPEQSQFWTFTFEQMALYDTPAVIRFIQNFTGHRKIGYVGHSQGGTTMFALLSLLPEYSTIIEPFIAWAPAVYIGHMTSLTQLLKGLSPLLQMLPPEQFPFSPNSTNYAVNLACSFRLSSPICSAGLDSLMGETTSLNQTRLPVITRFFPATSSTWNFIHYGQLYTSNSFIRYDYGNILLNYHMYGQFGPPLFPLGAIPPSTKIAIIHGNTDAFVANVDVERLIRQLKSSGVNVIDYKVPMEKWNHLDYLLGVGAGKLVHDKTIEWLDLFRD